MTAPEFITYPEFVAARDRIQRFVKRLEHARLATGSAADMQSLAVPGCLHIHGPAGNGKTHILNAMAATLRCRHPLFDDRCDPVVLLRADDLKTQTALLGEDRPRTANRYTDGGALLVDDVECLHEDPAARACLAKIALSFVQRQRLVVLAETSSAAPAGRTTVLKTDDLAWLRPITETVAVVPPGKRGIELLIRHFAHLHNLRFPRRLVAALAVSVLRLDQPNIRDCQRITTKLVAWCLFHRVKPTLDALEAMRADALRCVGLGIGLPRQPENDSLGDDGA